MMFGEYQTEAGLYEGTIDLELRVRELEKQLAQERAKCTLLRKALRDEKRLRRRPKNGVSE